MEMVEMEAAGKSSLKVKAGCKGEYTSIGRVGGRRAVVLVLGKGIMHSWNDPLLLL